MIISNENAMRAIVDIDSVIKLRRIKAHIRDNTIYLYLSNLYTYIINIIYNYKNITNTTILYLYTHVFMTKNWKFRVYIVNVASNFKDFCSMAFNHLQLIFSMTSQIHMVGELA